MDSHSLRQSWLENLILALVTNLYFKADPESWGKLDDLLVLETLVITQPYDEVRAPA